MAQEGTQQLKSDVRSDPPQVQPLAVPIREWGQALDSDTYYSCIQLDIPVVHDTIISYSKFL